MKNFYLKIHNLYITNYGFSSLDTTCFINACQKKKLGLVFSETGADDLIKKFALSGRNVYMELA